MWGKFKMASPIRRLSLEALLDVEGWMGKNACHYALYLHGITVSLKSFNLKKKNRFYTENDLFRLLNKVFT